MATQNKVIHRFIREFSDYDINGTYYAQIIPVDTQAYAIYPEDSNTPGIYYVIGDGVHTYLEIKNGHCDSLATAEYPVFTKADLTALLSKVDKSYVDTLINKLKEIVSDLVVDFEKVDERLTKQEADILDLIENTYTKSEMDELFLKYTIYDDQHKTVQVSAPIVEIEESSDVATHYSNKGVGGWHQVNTMEELNSIKPSRKVDGMAVYVMESDSLYILKNNEWVAFTSQAKSDGFVHRQHSAKEEWRIYHGLDRFPCVMVVDDSKTQVFGEIIYEGTNSLIVTFNEPISGYAYLN